MVHPMHCSPISWAAAELRLGVDFQTSFESTARVVDNLEACISSCRVNTTPSLAGAVREFMGDENLSLPRIRAFLAQLVTVLKCTIAGIMTNRQHREWIAQFFDVLHIHLPEWEIEPPRLLQLA